MFYLQKGDSLQLHLNTREFDESLMYSGAGSVPNNYLMRLFLDNERNNKIFLTYYKYSPKGFAHKTDSIKDFHLSELEKLDFKYDFSDEFENIAKDIINYAFYDLRERYFFLIDKYNQKLKADLPKGFLSYRKNVDFNDKTLQSYYIYQYFLTNYLKNKSIEECLAKTEKRNCFDLNSKSNLKRRMVLADSLFELKSLRNRFLSRFARYAIVYSNTKGNVDSIVDFLKKADFDPNKLKMYERLGKIQKKNFMGNIAGLDVLTPSKKRVKISSLLKKNTVFYYWSVYSSAHNKNTHNKIEALSQRYPEINFIGINIDNDDYGLWKTSLENFGYAQSNEYQIICAPKDKMFYQVYLNKLVFVNKKGEVLDGNLKLQDSKLENKLLELLNR